MTNLKRSFFSTAIYLAFMFILGQFDYARRPIIDFAAYFYLAVMVAVPVTLFFPSIARVPVYVPLVAWMGAYLVLLQINNRIYADNGQLPVIVLEFVLLEVGVWFAHQLAVQINHAESVMDALALSAFPNRARDIEAEHQRIKIELTRSRRYHRPLSLIVIQSESGTGGRSEAVDETVTREMLKSLQHDLLSRFTSARVGQIIDDCIRQTDLVMRDHRGRFIVLCPETDRANASLLAKRISQAVTARTSLRVLWGVAAFPEEALTFDDLLQTARERLADSMLVPAETIAVAESSD
ncbi:MAG TPA: diguanylate cyclase [Anaerolineales bacterium]|nr:diguanylate cyclase [Anaerolineales bacterium]